MIMDSRNEFCDAVSVADTAQLKLIGNVMDLGAVTRDLGNGQPLYFNITVDTEIITGGSAGTIQFYLASDAQEAIAVDESATIHLSSASLVTDDAAANGALCSAGATILCAALPQGTTYERYLGVLCRIGTTTTTAGKINAFLSDTPRGNPAYPDAI